MKLDKIKDMYKACSQEITSRTNEIQHLLLGEGNYDSDIMIIADVPTAKEEEESQNLLDSDRNQLLKVLSQLDVTLEDVFITHLMKYRPYKVSDSGRITSRTPSDEEYAFFMPYLKKEISLINPKLIITLGTEPLRRLVDDKQVKVNPEEDQLLVVGVHGKSYKLYPLHHPTSKQFSKSISGFQEHQDRLHSIIHGSLNDELVKELRSKVAEAKEAKQSTKGNNIEKKIQAYDFKTQSVKADDNNGEERNTDNDQVELTEGKERVFEKIQPRNSSKTKLKRSYVTLVYGGEGFIDDPSLIVLERITKVLTELEVGIHKIDLSKGKASMDVAFEYIRESKGVVLCTCVEWYGMGYRMQQFLDDCFYHGETAYFMNIPLMGVSIGRQGFEKEAYLHILKSWQCLGGREGLSIEGVIPTAAALETNFDWLYYIDKKAENYYRIMQQDKPGLPTSGTLKKVEVKVPVAETVGIKPSYDEQKKPKGPELNDKVIIEDYGTFVEKQQKDIASISSIFKKKLSAQTNEGQREFPQIFMDAYKGADGVNALVQIVFDDTPRENTVLELNNKHIRSYFGLKSNVDLSISATKEVLQKIVDGKLSMQRAFMTGEVKAKGDFSLIYKFEEYFQF